MAQPITARLFKLGLIAAVALQFAVIGLFYFDVIRDQFHQPGTLIFHNGGDEETYFELAQSILSGKLVPSKYSLGFPLLLIPWFVVLKPQTAHELTPVITAFHAFILFPLAQVLLGLLAARITHHRSVALMSVLLWTLFPVILYLRLAMIGQAQDAGLHLVRLPWLQMLSDPPATFLAIASFWLLFAILDTPPTRARNVAIVLLGVACGLSLLIRVASILHVGIVMLMLASKRQWLALIGVGLFTVALFVPQFIYNAQFFGSPFTLGYQTLDALPPEGLFSLSYPIKALGARSGLALVGGAVGLGLMAGLATLLWRRDRAGSVVVVLWIVAYVLFYGMYYYAWNGDMMRFLMPMFPALAMLICSALLFRAPMPAGAEAEAAPTA